MKPPKASPKLNRLESEATALEQQVDLAVAHYEKIERDKKKIEQEEIERGILRHHRDQLAAADRIEPFLDSISKIESELRRRQEELKKLYQEDWPRERQERDSRRYEMEGLQARYRELNQKVLLLKLRLSQESLESGKKSQADSAAEQKRRWNEALLAQEMAKLEHDLKTRPATPRDVAKLNELKADLAQNQDLSQPPPTISSSLNL